MDELASGCPPIPGSRPGDADIFAIASKCLASEPSQRYQSAAELHDDLNRYLHSYPVQARSVSAVERLRLWIKRDPVKPALGSLVFLVSIISIGLLTLSYHKERMARGLAERRAESIRSILADTLGFVADSKLRIVPGIDEERIDLLQRSVDSYRELVADHRLSLEHTHALSIALHALANAHSQTGQVREARKARSECLQLIAKLRQQNPVNEQYAYDEYMNSLMLACEWRSSEAELTKRYMERAIQVIKELIRKHPTNVDYRDALNAVNSDLAGDFELTGRTEEAKELWLDVARESQELANEHPNRPLLLKHATNALQRLGRLATVEQDYPTAKAQLLESLRLTRSLQTALPGEVFFREDEGSILAALGYLHQRLAETERSSDYYQAADKIWSDLRELHPDSLKYPLWLACLKRNHAQCLLEHGRTDGAVREYKQGIELLENMVRKDPTLAEVHLRIEEFRKDPSLGKLLEKAPQNVPPQAASITAPDN